MQNVATKTEIAVETRALGIRRGEKLLFERMSWALPRGKFLAVTGASGAGKSSLLACLGGFVEPSAGDFQIADADSIGFVFQNFRLTPNLSVLINVLCGRLGAYNWRRTLFGFPADESRAALAVLSSLGLENLTHKPVRRTSGGEQQRTAIARVLLQNPRLILADEPVSNLDANLARRVLQILRERCRTENQTVVAVLHNAEQVAEFADYELKIAADGWSFAEIAG